MNAILGFKNLEDDDVENCPCGIELREKLNAFHSKLMSQVSLTALQEPLESEDEETSDKPSECTSNWLRYQPVLNKISTCIFNVSATMKKLYSLIHAVKELEETPEPTEEPQKKSPEAIFRKVLISTIVRWAEESQIETSKLVREMFSLLVRQYDSVGELIRALGKTYVTNAKTRDDAALMWVGLSQIRSLLPVQMSQEEEGLLRERLW